MAALPAPSDDLDRIMTVMHAAFEPEYNEAWTRRQVEDSLLIGHCHYLLAGPEGGERLGNDEQAPITGFVLSRGGFGEEELLLLAVEPQYRRRGIGARLLDRLFTAARLRGNERLLLEMRRGNPAEALYRAHGFVPVGVRPAYYRTRSGARIDAITFARTLD